MLLSNMMGSRRCDGTKLAGALFMIGALACGIPSSARADGDNAPPASPRTSVQIGDASVVLIAANERLYAFVDNVDDNAPVTDGQLGVVTASGTKLDMSQATGGLFIGPMDYTGHAHDAFTVSLRSSAGTGEAQAEIIYNEAGTPIASDAQSSAAADIVIALVSGCAGAIGATFLMLRRRNERRRAAERAMGSAQAA